MSFCDITVICSAFSVQKLLCMLRGNDIICLHIHRCHCQNSHLLLLHPNHFIFSFSQIPCLWHIYLYLYIYISFCSFMCQKWWKLSSHAGVGVGLCGYEDGWSGQFLPGRFSGSMDREWWLLLEICLCCFSLSVCVVQVLLSCWLWRFLCPCEQMFATSLCLAQSAPMLMSKGIQWDF